MKNLISIIGVVSLIFLGSCEKFLEVENEGKLTEEQFYNNVNDIQRAVAAVYSVISTDDYMKTIWLFGEGMGDDVVLKWDNPTNDGQHIFTFTFTSENDEIQKRWDLNYEGIFRANYAIRHAERVYQELMDFLDTQPEANRSSYTETWRKLKEMHGQAKFMRAFFYFNLVKSFGGVPIQPEELVIEGNEHNFIQPRATVEEVYEYIEKDLREAALGMESLYGVDQPRFQGMITRSAAFGYLIKVLAYQAGSGVNDPHWQEIVDICEFFVDKGVMTFADIIKLNELYPGETWEDIQYRNLLYIRNGEVADINTVFPSVSHNLIDHYDQLDWESNEFGPESIFEINFAEYIDGKSGEEAVSTGVWDEIMPGQTGGWWAPSGYTSNEEGNGTDPRWSYAIASAILTFDAYPNGLMFRTEPTLKAVFKHWTVPAQMPLVRAESGRNVRLMRYAEVLLFYAEALNETGNSMRALELVNRIRERANNLVDLDYMSQYRWLPQLISKRIPANLYNTMKPYTETRDIIWKERRIELCYEFDRWWDMLRTGTYIENIAEFNRFESQGQQKKFIPGVHELLPIPQEEVRLSNGVIQQNPGY